MVTTFRPASCVSPSRDWAPATVWSVGQLRSGSTPGAGHGIGSDCSKAPGHAGDKARSGGFPRLLCTTQRAHSQQILPSSLWGTLLCVDSLRQACSKERRFLKPRAASHQKLQTSSTFLSALLSPSRFKFPLSLWDLGIS